MYYIGVEIGGTKQQVCVGTAGGQILQRRQVKLGEDTTARNILVWIRESIEQLRQEFPIAASGRILLDFSGEKAYTDEKTLSNALGPRAVRRFYVLYPLL